MWVQMAAGGYGLLLHDSDFLFVHLFVVNGLFATLIW